MHHSTQPDIEIRSSARRRKSGVAFWEGGKIVVVVPARMSRAGSEVFAQQLVETLLSRTARRHASDAGLAARSGMLADQYLDGVRPASIRWSTRQHKRWGSCSLHSREIRIAARLQTVPEWVLDAVIVHELTHLVEANHSARFYELAARYQRQGEAHIWLEGFGHGLSTAGFQAPGDPDDDGHEADSEPEASELPSATIPGPGASSAGSTGTAGEVAAYPHHRAVEHPAR